MENTKTYITIDETLQGFTYDDLYGFMQTATTKILAAAARGEIDLNLVAKQTLTGRGQDLNGKWVGFKKAKEINNI